VSDDRGLTPVVAKTLEIGIVLLYVSFVSTALFGGVVPHARSNAAGVVGDRTLATAATSVEDAVPRVPAAAVSVEAHVPLPDTLRGRPYEIRAHGRTLVLDSQVPGLGGRTALSLPSRVAAVNGTWHSGRPAVVVVRGNASGLRVELREGTR